MTKVKLVNESGKKFPANRWEEHYSVTSEPGGHYLTHFTPVEAGAVGISNKLLEFFNEHGLDVTLEVIGGDSTNCNTGWKVSYLKKKHLLCLLC